MEDYPEPVSEQCTKKILDQMNNSFYKIKEINGKFNLGFFCSIKNQENNIPVIVIFKYIKQEEISDNIDILINKETKNI